MSAASPVRSSEDPFITPLQPMGGKRDREFQITAIALLIISLFLIAVGITLMGIGHMPSVLTSGIAAFFCYFAGAHLTFVGLGVLVSSVVFSVLGACRTHQRCSATAPALLAQS